MTTTPAPTPSTAAPPPAKRVQNPLTLIMTLKSEQDYLTLSATLAQYNALPDAQNPIVQAMNDVGTVHFARFVFLDHTRLAVITTFDGDLGVYLQDFAAKIGGIFDLLFAHMAGAPPSPVQQHPDEFLTYVQANNLTPAGFYSAYPTKTVLDILSADS